MSLESIICDSSPHDIEVTSRYVLRTHKHTHTQTGWDRNMQGYMESVEAWRGGWGGYKGLVQHINQARRCVCVPLLSLAWGWGAEQDCAQPSPNDRANCTLYKSLWPSNTTSTHIKPTLMHMYLNTNTKSLIDCMHLRRHTAFNLNSHADGQGPELGRGDGTVVFCCIIQDQTLSDRLFKWGLRLVSTYSLPLCCFST